MYNTYTQRIYVNTHTSGHGVRYAHTAICGPLLAFRPHHVHMLAKVSVSQVFRELPQVIAGILQAYRSFSTPSGPEISYKTLVFRDRNFKKRKSNDYYYHLSVFFLYNS